MSLDMNEFWKHAVRLSLYRVFWEVHYAKIEDLEIPYLRDYYYVQLAVAGLGLVGSIEAEYAKNLMEELLQMRVDAEIDPADPKNKETLSDLAEFKKTIRDLKPKIVQSMGVSMDDFDKRMHEATLEKFLEYDDAESDDEETQLEDHEEILEVDSDDFQAQPKINGTVFVRITWGEFDTSTNTPTPRLIEFIQKYKDYVGFDESIFYKATSVLIIEINHSDRTVRNHVGMQDYHKLQERQVLEGFSEISLKDFMI